MVYLTHIMHQLVNVQFFPFEQLLLYNLECRVNIPNQVFHRNSKNYDVIKKQVSGSLQASIRSNSILLTKTTNTCCGTEKWRTGLFPSI